MIQAIDSAPLAALAYKPNPDRYTLTLTDYSSRTAVTVSEIEPFDEAALYTPYGCWIGCVERLDQHTWRLVCDEGKIDLPVADCILLKLEPLQIDDEPDLRN